MWINGVPVDSHNTYHIWVGAGGNGPSEAGGVSSFSLSDAWRLVAYGGAPGSHHVGGQGGTWGWSGPEHMEDLTKGGGSGGRGGDASWKNETVDDVAGGGGGAGGYEGGWWDQYVGCQLAPYTAAHVVESWVHSLHIASCMWLAVTWKTGKH
jgi:hypothetical protein